MTSNDRGSATMETIFLCLILLIPVAWGLATLDRVHRAALASTAAVRDAGFEAVRATDLAAADLAIDGAVAGALRDQGIDSTSAHVKWAAPGGLARGTRVDVSVTVEVEVFGDWLPFASVPVSARHSLFVERYGSRDA